METTQALLALEGDHAGKAFPVGSMEIVMGRSRSCEITLNDDNVSRRHAVLRPQDGDVMIEDLGSTHGTFLNDRRLRGILSLHEGDTIMVGAQKFQLVSRAEAEEKVGKLTPLVEEEFVPPPPAGGGEEEAEHDRTRFAGEVEAMDTQYHAMDQAMRHDEDDDDHTRALVDQATRMLDAEELQGLKPGREESKNLTKTVMGAALVVALLGGGLYMIANLLGGEGRTAAEFQSYHDPQFGFRVTYPGPWFRNPGQGANVINFERVEEGETVASLRVFVDQSLEFETRGLTMGFEDYRTTLQRRYGDTLVIRPPMGGQVGELPVRLFGFYNATHQGKGFFLISGRTRYVLETVSPRAEYPAYSRLYTRLLDSFRLDEPEVIIDFPAADEELVRMALGEEARLLQLAQQEWRFAQNLVRRKDVRPENRFRAVETYQRVMQMLSALNQPPEWAEQAGRELAEATRELQEAIRESRFIISMAHKVNDATTIYWESAKLMQMIPDKTDPVYEYARRRNELFREAALNR